jgi:hypothetical protein
LIQKTIREATLATAIELLRQGKKNQIWTKYCGFLDLTMENFMKIQERLLLEQVNLLRDTEIGKKFFGDCPPASVAEFRKNVPITSYEDYQQYLDEKRVDGSYDGAYIWAHTSGRSGQYKWIPYTHDAYLKLGERVLGGVILGAAREKGDVQLEDGDVLVYNTPPRPYISGVTLRALAEHFSFRFVPPLDETEQMGFQERIEKGFATGMDTGIDILGSISVVLVKMGEEFAKGARSTKLSTQMLRPRVAFRLIRGFIRSQLERRPMLPKDLWTLKVLPCGGMDTSIYRDKILYYWGVAPYEQYGSTEEGAIATQAWNKKDMTFFPDAVFLEFIPEEEWAKTRSNPTYVPQTVLLSEVVSHKRYEVLITNFYGKPLLRYHTHDLVQFTSMNDEETGVNLPQMSFVGRSADFIDLAGFTGLIDEKMIWQAIVHSGIEYTEWAMCKEVRDEGPILHLYIETKDPISADEVHHRIHTCLKETNPFYADYEGLIEKQALAVTILRQGTFQAYMSDKQAAGTDLAHLKPKHMNPPDEEIALLLQKSALPI